MTARPRLTPHQQEVYERIWKTIARTGKPAPAFVIGSRMACRHLVEKGYIVAEAVPGHAGEVYRCQP